MKALQNRALKIVTSNLHGFEYKFHTSVLDLILQIRCTVKLQQLMSSQHLASANALRSGAMFCALDKQQSFLFRMSLLASMQ